MVKGELIKDVFGRISNLAGILAEYSKTRNKKTFINKFFSELIDIKGVDAQEEKALIESLIAFIESLVKLFMTAKKCFCTK